MKPLEVLFKLLHKWGSAINFANSAKLIAAQLRTPSGLLAKKVGNKMNKSNQLLYELVLDQIKIKQGAEILEIGFGNGKLFNTIFSKAKDLKIYGLEFSRPMFQEASKYNQNLIKNGKLVLSLGSSDRMPFVDDQFDAVLCINVIYFWENPEAHLQEIYRTLKPKGKLFVGIRPQAILASLPFSKFGFHLRPENEWIKIFLQNGFLLQDSLTQNEPLLQMGRKSFPMQGLCMVFEKKSL